MPTPEMKSLMDFVYERRGDFLSWALVQCKTNEQRGFAHSISRAIGEISFAEAEAAFLREIEKSEEKV